MPRQISRKNGTIRAASTVKEAFFKEVRMAVLLPDLTLLVQAGNFGADFLMKFLFVFSSSLGGKLNLFFCVLSM